MSNRYIIKKIEEKHANGNNIWEEIPAVRLENCLWEDNGYFPRSEAKVYYTDKALHVLLISYEKEIKAIYENMNDSVCKDSCMEFFVNPTPEVDDRFLNFEFNPLGTLLLGLGKDRYVREDINLDWRDVFSVRTSVDKNNIQHYSGPFWFVEFSIPFSFLTDIYGPIEFKSGKIMKANFYKCGDETAFPHYLAWNNIPISTPDFHRPEFFGELILE